MARARLVEDALDYVLEHGLIGLSLRPLAAGLGTSDRMLIYHFGSKDALIAEVLTLANERVAEAIAASETPEVASVAEFVRTAWELVKAPGTTTMMGLYVEMCALTVRDPQRWRAAQARLRSPWTALLGQGLHELGVDPARVPALADLLLDTFDGLLLDRLVTDDPSRSDAAVAAFAELLER